MIEAGRLRHRIELQDYTAGQQDSHGNDLRDYFAFAANLPAEIIDGPSRALYTAQQQFTEATAIINIRYLAGVTDKMRVYHPAEGTYYDIINVGRVNSDRLSAIRLVCKIGITDDR